MKIYQVGVARMIDAPLEAVYRVVTDMNVHIGILPRQFETLEVLQGGSGSGTVFRLTMNVMGIRSSLQMRITEPIPGRVIREQDDKAGVTTTWTLKPSDDSKHCYVDLMTEFPSKPGLAGVVERLLVSPIIRSIYHRELDNINVYLTTGIAARKDSVHFS
ncbi:SRPBCC family protein [Paenibacillus sp. H1-7]|uniref:SRPBCC family protein n=1 Tax=Paenibacillus sp. H1-7 TaxID=2282849 RepID=UPI001EF7CD34|nr:SRPBCC family protein [Paenibacillus sp. H1-7]ULL14857.1 SRPBCC family protein [Paenibacillus sp. H1-7]